MAEFCYDCTGEIAWSAAADLNDFRRESVGWTRWAFHLCEGCGAHLFDHHGRRMCLTGMWPRNVPEPMPGECAGCSALADDVRSNRRGGLLRRCDSLGRQVAGRVSNLLWGILERNRR